MGLEPTTTGITSFDWILIIKTKQDLFGWKLDRVIDGVLPHNFNKPALINGTDTL
jgi:hypothetical protein